MMFKRLAAFGLAAVMACSLAFPAAAEYVEDKELTIGTALAETAEEFERDDYRNGDLKKYNGNSETVTVPSDVKKITAGAFSGNTKIKSITIPASVTSISDGAFDGCTSLTTIKVNSANPKYEVVKGVLYEWETRNDSHSQRKWVHTYPAAKTGKSFTVPSGVYGLRPYAFSGNKNLQTVKLSDTVKEIGNGAFRLCKSLTKVTLTNNVTSIGDNVFKGSAKLQSITGMTEKEHKKAKYITKDGVLYHIDYYDELMCYPEGKKDASFSIPQNVSTPHYSTDYRNVCLLYSSIVDNIYLKKLTLASNTNLWTRSHYDFFTREEYFKQVPFFSGCTSLESVNVAKGNNGLYSKDGVLFSVLLDKNYLEYYPVAKKGDSYTVPKDTIVAYCAFAETSKLKTLAFSETSMFRPNFIGSDKCSISAFKVSSKDTRLSVKDGVLYNKDKTVLYCVPPQCAKTSIKLPSTVSTVGWYAFRNCMKLESVEIPRGVASLYFDNCPLLKSVTLPLSISFVDGTSYVDDITLNQAAHFSGCGSLTKITYQGLRENLSFGDDFKRNSIANAINSGKITLVCADD